MQYRRFGRTELQMPVFSCGGMRYQYKWQDVPRTDIPPDNQANLEATIKRSLELGINHIETARGYGTSEMQLGQILPHLPRQEMIVQTKIAPYSTAAEFRKEFDTSFNYLQLDYVDLLGIHGINNRELMEYTLRPGGCLEEAKKLQQEGKVKFIGFSTHAPLEVILEIIQSNQFDYVNLHWYYINQANWGARVICNGYDYAKKIRRGNESNPFAIMFLNTLLFLVISRIAALLDYSQGSDIQHFSGKLRTSIFLQSKGLRLPPVIHQVEKCCITYDF